MGIDGWNIADLMGWVNTIMAIGFVKALLTLTLGVSLAFWVVRQAREGLVVGPSKGAHRSDSD